MKDFTSTHTRQTLADLREELLRIVHVRGGHATSSLSCLEILLAVYAQPSVNIDAPKSIRFIISKGHAEIGIYLALRENGYLSAEDLSNNYRFGDYSLSGHISKTTPGIIYSAGSLGHGLAYSVGLAYADKLKGRLNRTVTLISDGETCEGSTLEAIQSAFICRLDNILVILDNNKIASCSFTTEISSISAFEAYASENGFATHHINGHSVNELYEFINIWVSSDRPIRTLLIADTIKGKGFKHLQGSPLWHVLPIDDDALSQALLTSEEV
jgi:transketolase